MRILNRPMFKYGGPIKEGIMHGMKNGGRTLLVGQHPKQFHDASGREQHWAPLVGLGAAAMRFLPAAYRGFKAARAYKPWSQNLGAWGRVKDIFKPSSGIGIRMGAPGEGAGFRTGALLRSNPITALSLAPQAGALGYSAAKGGLKAIPGLAKGYVEAILPGDQSGWWKDKDKEPPSGIIKPGGFKKIIKEEKPDGPSDAELEAEAKAARTKKLNKYLETMGYDKAKKTAIGDALIDASAIVQGATDEAGSLKKADWGKMINQAIQTTSKRLDKPEQIREAVGLMMTKADIEKDLEDPQVKRLRALQIEDAEEKLDRGFEKDMREFILARKEAPDKNQLERFARLTADEYGIAFKKVDDKALEGLPEGATDEEIMTAVVGEDGIYMIGQTIVRVKDGIPKQIG